MRGTRSDSDTRPLTHPDAPFLRRNYSLGVVNGTLVRLGNAFLDPALVLSAYVYELTGSNALVGILVALASAGIMWPQLYISSLIEHRPRKLPFYIGLLGVRLMVMLAMTAAIWLGGAYPNTWTLVLFFGAFFVYRSAQGSGAMPFFDIVGRALPPQRLGGFFAWRALFGDSLGLLAGFLLVQPALHRIPFPVNYAVLTFAAIFVLGVGWGAFCLVHEEPNEHPPRRRSMRETLVAASQVLKVDPNYRGLLSLRVLFRVNALALAFYVPYGIERLGAVGLAGVFIGVMSASKLTSSLFWGRISERRGNRACLIGAGAFFMLSPLAALLAPRLPGAFQWMIPGSVVALDLRLVVYLLALSFFGFALQGNMIGANSFLIEISPPDRRPSYMAFLNTITFPLTLLPAVVGGLVGGTSGLDALFAVVAVSGLLTLVTATRLREVRKGVAQPLAYEQ